MNTTLSLPVCLAIVATVGSLTLPVRVEAADNADHADHADHREGKNPMAEKLKTLQGQEFEKMFLKEMIQHHKDGIQMASMAVQKAHNAEVKSLAQKNVDNQSKESQQMTEWLQSWHNDRPKAPNPEEPSVKKMMRQMEELRAASASQFDQKFLTHFSDHHQGAIEMSRLAKEKKVREELAQMSEKMIKDQTKDIQEMQKLKTQLSTSASR